MICSINNARLLRTAPVSYSSPPGTNPSPVKIIVDDEVLPRVRDNPFDVTLRIGERYISGLKVKAIGSASGSLGEHVSSSVVLVDRRHYWGRIKYSAAFNIRRRTGEIALAEGDVPLAVQDSIPQLRYYTQTLNGQKPYTLREALEKVLRDTKQEPFAIPPNFPDVNVFGAKGFQQDGSLRSVIDGLLAFAPDWTLARDDDGTVRFYERSDIAAEAAAEAEMRPKIFGAGWAKASDRSYDRPSKVIIRFYVEPELRWDYEESTEVFNTLPRIDAVDNSEDAKKPLLEAAIDTPVPGLLSPDGKEVARGSIMGFYYFLTALQAASNIYPLSPNASGNPWDYHAIIRLYMRPWDVKAQFAHFGGFIDRNWDRITRASLGSFRTYYRLPQSWADRVKILKPFRVELIDPVSLTRRKSPVFSDYLSKPAQRLATVYSESDADELAWSTENAVSDVTKDCQLAPAKIVGVDNESKSFQVLYKRSPRGRDDDVFPVTIEDPPKVINQSNLRLAVEAGQRIDEGFEMATIMTTIPQPSPGSKAHFHSVEVTPAEAAEVLGIPEGRLGSCLGPVWEVIVPPSPSTTARFVWSDDAKDELIAPFFDSTARFPVRNLQNAEDVNALAKAHAAVVYRSKLDTFDGHVSSPAIKQPPGLVGSMKSVTTTAYPDPKRPITTTVVYGEPIPQGNPYALLPNDIRNRILGDIIP